MGRAPNQGAPQRVSAHVVPKGQPFSGSHASIDDEEEKTTIESGWEEEASTTVEQGEVAEKIRALGLDPPRRQQITNTGSVMDEPTVDDQRANAALSMITPPSVLARMIITHGNDKGQDVEIIPGKSYTIGRAIDNDIVLTDIAVSRKHFDMRHENGAWVLADRGSGNGTLVNGNLEDQPFMLANGDLIEIGNTTFRFDFPNAPPRTAFAENAATNGFGPSTNGQAYDTSIDEEEPSTVAGKPVRDSRVIEHVPTPPLPDLRARPKTVPPPPPPMRSRPVSNPPPLYPPGPNGSQGLPPALQATIGPHQGMSPVSPQMMPAMSPPMARVLASQAPTLLGDAALQLQNVMPTTLPGQGPPVQPQPPHINQLPFTYPNVADHAAHQRMMVASSQIPRDATATAHVPPTPFGQPLPYNNTYAPPQLSRRAKLLLGGAGLAIVAAIATAAIIKAASGDDDTTESGGDTTEAKKDEPKPTVQPIIEKQDPPKKDPVVTTESPKKDPPKTDPPKKDPVVTNDPPKTDPPKKDPVVTSDPPKQDPPKKDPPKKVVVAQVDPPKKDPPRKDPPKKDPPKKDPPRKDPPRKDPPKRVAIAGGGDEAKTTASAQFRNRKFNEAAATLRAAAGKLGRGDASELRSLAGRYENFGRNFSVGMAPQTKANEAWSRLISARSFDSDGVFRDEINAQINKIAGAAAMTFLGAKNYAKALEAARVAEANGAKNTMVIVRSKVEDHAAELYAAASREIDSNPSEAKSKLKQIKGLVEPRSTWALKADKLLAGL